MRPREFWVSDDAFGFCQSCGGVEDAPGKFERETHVVEYRAYADLVAERDRYKAALEAIINHKFELGVTTCEYVPKQAIETARELLGYRPSETEDVKNFSKNSCANGEK